eukprot:m.279079 g.279079  ORF g.279079 m.279079 type:complete len:142 (-) comp16156_c0_seq4:1134-1559(-)
MSSIVDLVTVWKQSTIPPAITKPNAKSPAKIPSPTERAPSRKWHEACVIAWDMPVTSPIDAPGLSALCVAWDRLSRTDVIVSLLCPPQPQTRPSLASIQGKVETQSWSSLTLRGVGSLNAECNGAGWASAAGVRSGSVRLG